MATYDELQEASVVLGAAGLAGTGVTQGQLSDILNRLAEVERVQNSQNESLVVGRFYGPLSTLSGYPAPTGVAITANTLYAAPVYIPQTGVFDAMGIQVTTPAAAGRTMRVGIYEAMADGMSGALLGDLGTIDTTVAGFWSLSTFAILKRGSYWLAGAANSAVSVARVPAGPGLTATMGHTTTTGNDPRSGRRRWQPGLRRCPPHSGRQAR